MASIRRSASENHGLLGKIYDFGDAYGEKYLPKTHPQSPGALAAQDILAEGIQKSK